MNYLITGVEGFFGKNLFQELNREGNEIEEYIGDVSKDFFPLEKPDIIYHLAANTDTVFPDDMEMYRNNILGFLNVLKYAYDKKVKLIFASSGAIWGNGDEPLNAYSESKRMTEEIAKRYLDKMDLIGLRPFNVFGLGEKQKGKSASMITQWREQMLRGENPVIFEGDYRRDFIYIKDVLKGLRMAKNLKSGIYDLGTGIAIDFRDILGIIIKIMNVKIEPRFIKNPYLGKYQTFTKANINWGFKPDYTIESGIKDYFENYE